MKTGKTAFYLVCLTAALAILPIASFPGMPEGHYELSRFIAPEVCGGCHDTIYEQWKNSLHHLAQSDRVYRAAAFYYLEGLTDRDEIAEAESCVKCHTPVGFFSGFPVKTSEEKEGKVAGIAAQGVQCDFCHSATGARTLFNNNILLDPGHGESRPGTKRGPFADSRSDYHVSAHSKFHTGPEICAVCHDVRHVVYGTKLETTYEEWQASPYNSADSSKRLVCQDCHMYQRPGIPATGSTKRPKNPGLASADGPAREHVFTHFFVGGNSFIPSGSGDKVKAAMAVERLQNAAVLDLDVSAARAGSIVVTVKNTGAGHSLPTGLTDVRQVWLQVRVTDESGAPVFETGVPDANGYLPDGTILYNTVFGDGKGNPVENIAKAREVLKNRRVPAGGSLYETISVSPLAGKRFFVEAKLLYAVASQKLLDRVAGKGTIRVPIVTMAEIKKSI
ncbi:MAG: cytochrome c554 family protein [Spirochaetes bacterium]|nr:MAG: cytochrome c554 family protein [Spirochaetota bacterium]